MTDGEVEAALLRQSAGVGDDCQSVHLQLVVVVEAQRLIDPDTRVKLEAALFQTMLAAGMAGVENGHIILLCQRIDGSEQTQEVLFRVDVLLTVGRQQNVLVLFQPKTLQHVAFLNLFQIHVQHFRHGRAGLVGALLGQTGICQILPGKLRIAHIHVRNYIHDAAIGLLGQALILAAVSCLHVKQRDVQTFCTDGRKAGVGIAQHQIALRLQFREEFIAASHDVSTGHAEIFAHHGHQNVGSVFPKGVFQFKVFPENGGEVSVPVLIVVDHAAVKVFPATLDNRSQSDNLRTGTATNHDLGATVVFPFEIVFHIILLLTTSIFFYTGSKKVSGWFGSKISLQVITVTRFSVSDKLMIL